MARKKQILDLYSVDTVLDVGANTGQYAQQLRQIGYNGRILSFEPLSAAWQMLAAKARRDALWETFHHALGDTDGQSTIHVAQNSYSSSLRNMLPLHTDAAPESTYVGTESIEVKALDAIFDSLAISGSNILMKLDTQGFEKNVIEGAKHSLRHIDTIELEMSLEPLYEGESLCREMYPSILALGYQPVSIQDEFYNSKTGRLLQVQTVFHRFQT